MAYQMRYDRVDHRMNRICARCGKRFGNHYGGPAWCKIEDAKASTTTGPFFIESGAYRDEGGHIYTRGEVKVKMDPNIAFRLKGKKS